MQNNTSLPQETLQQYGKLMNNLWEPRPNPLITNYDQTILYWAVTEGNIQVINFILDITNSSETVLKDLLTKKTSVPHDTVFERNVLYLAAKQVVIEQLKMTQGRGDIAKQKLYENIIEIFLVITNGKTEIQKKMLLATFFHQEYKTDPVNKYLFDYINTKHSNNNFLKNLTHLVKEKEYLIKELNAIWNQGVDINIQDLKALAIKGEDQDVMSVLLNIQYTYDNCSNDSILSHAVIQGHLNIVAWLITNGADVNAINAGGTSILHYAHIPDIIKLLLQKNAYVHVIDTEGWTTLHHISNTTKDVSSIIPLLVDKGININAQNNLGETALHDGMDCEAKHFNTIKTLVELGADINATDNKGCTALHTYAVTKRWDFLQLLINHGGDVYARNEQNYSVLDIAYYCLGQEPQSLEKQDMLDYLSNKFPDDSNINSVSISGRTLSELGV